LLTSRRGARNAKKVKKNIFEKSRRYNGDYGMFKVSGVQPEGCLYRYRIREPFKIEYVSCEFLFGGSLTILEFSLTLQPSIRIDYSDIGDMMVKQKLWFG